MGNAKTHGSCLKYLQYRMLRQAQVGQNDTKTELRRCLNTCQLTMIGVGSTIGVGIFVLLGIVAKENAGWFEVDCHLLDLCKTVFLTVQNHGRLLLFKSIQFIDFIFK